MGLNELRGDGVVASRMAQGTGKCPLLFLPVVILPIIKHGTLALWGRDAIYLSLLLRLPISYPLHTNRWRASDKERARHVLF